MSNKTEGVHAGEFLLSEAGGTRSRDEITLAATTVNLPAGQLLGKVTATGEHAPYDPLATDGTEAAAGILWAPAGTSAAAQRAVAITRDAEVVARLLTGVDTAGENDLFALGIVIRP